MVSEELVLKAYQLMMTAKTMAETYEANRPVCRYVHSTSRGHEAIQLAKRDDIFSGGRSYYCHPSYRGPDKPTIIHQSSATGMQVIPATGIAQGVQHLERYLPHKLVCGPDNEKPIVVSSLGDASITE